MRFATSSKMSSYLAAVAVGEFEYIEGSADGIPIRIYSTPGKKQLGTFALEATKSILAYFDKYFGIKYPYEKLDLIGLPDFSAGAMENVALITSREALLQLDDRNASLGQRKAVAITISHEVAHQWFGDLVTDAMVGRCLAKRRLRHMDGKQTRGCVEAGLEHASGRSEPRRRPHYPGALNVDSLATTRSIHQPADTPAADP